MPTPDTFFSTMLEIKESVVRTEAKVDAMSKFEERISSLEDSRSRVYGIMTTITVAWVALIAWINGLGDWIRK